MPGPTFEELSARIKTDRWTLGRILQEERERGHVVCRDGRWMLDASFEIEFGPVLAALDP
jgi:hypothetical protein